MGLLIFPDDGGNLPQCAPNEQIPEGLCSDRREALGIDILCSRKQTEGTSCCLDGLVHESTHPADLSMDATLLMLGVPGILSPREFGGLSVIAFF